MDDEIIELLPNEKGYGSSMIAGLQEGVMITSIYKLSHNSNLSHTEITNNFKRRATDILNTNKWLMARLKHLKKPTKRLALVISQKHTTPDDYILIETNENVQNMENIKSESEVSFKTAKSVLSKHDVGWSKNLWDKENGKMCKFGQIWNPEKTTCYMFLVINHCLSDGASVYKIWKMLAPEVEVTSLNPIRKQDFDQGLKSETSLLPEGCTMESLYSKLNSSVIPAMLVKGFCQGVKGTTFKECFLKFDKKFIEQEKAKYCDGTKFVSTNDVLTSWFGNLIQKRNAPKFDNLMLAFDCRSRVPGVEQNMTGNYITAPIMRKLDLETPKTVRNWINFVTEKGNSWKYPSYSEFRKFIGGINTNWVKFYHHVEPKGLEQVIHFPVFADLDIRLGLGIPLGNELNIIIFKSGKEDISCYMYSRRDDVTIEGLLREDMVEAQLMKS